MRDECTQGSRARNGLSFFAGGVARGIARGIARGPTWRPAQRQAKRGGPACRIEAIQLGDIGLHTADKSSEHGLARPPRPAYAFPLSRLFVITTRSSASASELIINALKPYMPVVVVGDNSYGKPVGQYGFRVCDKMLWPVSFSVQNSRGQGDYYAFVATAYLGIKL